MDEHQDISEQSSAHSLSASERSLQAKIVRLENQLQGYKSQIDILDDQRQKLEERTLNMESALMKTKKELLEAKRELLDKDLTEMKLSEKLNAMNIQAEKYKHLFMAESTKNRCGIEKLEELISKVKSRMAPVATLNQFEDLKELVAVIQEGFQTQIMMVLDKLHEAEKKPSPKLRFQLNQGKKTNGKPLFTLGRPSSQLSSGLCGGFYFEPAKPPFDVKLPFGSGATDEDGAKSTFTFGASVDQTPKSSSGSAFQISGKTAQVKPAFIFGSLDQTPKLSFGAALLGSEKAAETKPAFILDSLDQMPKSSSRAASIGNKKATETKPSSVFGSQDKKTEGKPLFVFGSGATSSGTGFTFGSTAPSSGTGFSFALAGTSEGSAKPFSTFRSSNQTPNTSSGSALIFDSLKQDENVTTELQAEKHKRLDDSQSDKHSREEDNIAATAIAGATRHSGKDLLAKFKAEEGSWECDCCMVRNSSDKLECVACVSSKPGVEESQNKKMGGKPLFAFGSAELSTGRGFSFGSGSAPSRTGFLFGSAATNEGGAKPFFSFGSSSQTPPNASSGTSLIFGSSKRGGNVTAEQIEEDKEDVSRSGKHTPDEEVEQPGNEEENGGTTVKTQAGESKKEETTPDRESETSTQGKQDVTDPGSSKERKTIIGSSLSFHSVAASSISDSPFGKKTTKSPGFAGAGSTLFASQSPGGEHHDEEEHDGDHDGPYFDPIIPLPDNIDVNTGEEDDETMFSHRAKLYRFVAEEKQWKERGVGDIKLLRSAKTGKMRVLMRRERVLKLCANHQITTDMTLQPNAGSDRSWVWSTLADFSEEEHKPERLAVKFKTEGIAKQFKEKFEECQEILKNQASLELPVQEETANEEEVKEDLFAKFKAEKGSWECDICMVRNSSDKVQCVACASPKPGVELSQVSSNIGKPLFSYGSGALSGLEFSFGFTGATDGAGGVFVPPSSEGFLFGSGGSSSETGFLFGSAGASEASGQEDFSFGTSPRAPFSFSIQQQGGNTPGTQDLHSTDEGDDSSVRKSKTRD